MMKKEKIKATAFNVAGLGAVFVCTLAFLFTALMLTSLIPKDAIRENLQSTAEYYTSGKPFPSTDGILQSTIDNYADCIIFNIISSVRENDLLGSLMRSGYYKNENNNVSAGLALSAEMDVAPNTEYSRYWHGSMVILRPLLLVTDIKGIIVLNWIVIIALTALNGWVLIRKNHWEAFLFMLIGMAGVQIWYVPFCVCYSVPFIIMLTATVAFVLCDEKKGRYLPVLSVITGCVTCFMDFLTTETMTILVPLLTVLVVRHKEGRTGTLKENIVMLVRNGAAWGISYGLMYPAKWMISAIVTGEDTFKLAVDAAEVRINGGGVFTSWLRNISALYPFKAVGDIRGIYITVAVLAVIAVLAYAFRNKKADNTFIVPVIISGLVPYLRFAVLNAHSADHCFFTYRAQIASVMAVAAVFWFIVKKPDTVSRNKHKNKGK